ncbi:DNA cytosine methyltransferase [Castellaniella sp.]|uniref:DNA cytosine methyltransferase n=1 Tax=Castellaniella sp. TaxID=1955812 RepID=UPI002AFFC6D7|nr:DNA cytosine methyltransferase [Castellaniella sp.]
MTNHSQMALPFPGELIIDNFAGGGGTSTGLEAAFGRPVDIAINHDPEALAMHALNHPYTKHLCESVWDIDPIEVTANRPVGLVWLSPDCKHFSKAKGGTPVSKHIRGLAWVGMRWVALTKPRVLMLENVEEFQTWGPVIAGADGSLYPDPKRKGKTFESFVRQLRQHGYKVDWRELRACDNGAPTIRKRLFLAARRDGLPVVWPEATHGDPASREVLAGMLAPYRTAAECIDFDLPAVSIFDRHKPLAANTQRRVAKGLWRHVLSSAKPYIVTNTTGHPGVAIDQPMPTVTTGNHHMLGQPVMTPFLTEHANASNQRTMPADAPLRTLCAQVKGGHFSVVAPTLAPLRGTSHGHMGGHSIKKPLSTVSAGGTHHALVGAEIVAAHIQRDMSQSVGHAADVPLGTVTAGGGGKSSLICTHLITVGYGEREGQQPRVHDIAAPLGTVVAGGVKQALVTAYLVQYYSEGGQDSGCAKPMPTVTTKARMGLVESVQVPADSLSPALRAKARACAALLHEYLPDLFPAPAELVLMNYGSTWWTLADITLRMLKARELYRAQSFPDDYIIHEIPDPKLLFKDGIQVPGDPRLIPRIPLTITAQVRMCGNSVSPAQAEALVRANFRHESLFMDRVA